METYGDFLTCDECDQNYSSEKVLYADGLDQTSYLELKQHLIQVQECKK